MNRHSDEENDPLLLESGVEPRKDAGKKYQPGQLEISRATRYGILAGIWTATFLSVCNILLPLVLWSAQHPALNVARTFKVVEQ